MSNTVQATPIKEPVIHIDLSTPPNPSDVRRSFLCDDYLQLPREKESWLIRPLIPVSGTVNIYGDAKTGKAMALDTLILTIDGWKPLTDIHPGDWVFGSSGKPVHVIAESSVILDHPCMQVTFDDDSSFIVDEAHEWTVITKSDRPPVTVTTAQMHEQGTHRCESSRYPRAIYRVMLASALDFGPSAPLPLDPYCLGLWLGDGTASNGQFTTADRALAEAWAHAGYDIRKQPSNEYGYGIHGILDALRTLNILNNKHIPPIYMLAQPADRMALLAGLLDTDGHAAGGRAEFSNTNEQLARNVYDLAVQLGCKVNWSEKPALLDGIQHGLAYTVTIRAHFNPFRLERKARAFRCNTERYRTITSITPIKSVPVKCIVVDAPDHLFLAGRACIPTHNSYAALQLAAAISGTMHDWLGFPIASRGPVLYVQLDTPRNLWMDRIEEIKNSGYDLSSIAFADRESLDTWPFNILNPEHFKRLRTEVDRTNAVAVIIDVLKEAHHADENSSTEMQPVIAQLQNVCRPACLIILSHSRKAQMESGPDLVNDQRGSNYVPTRMDSIIRFTKKHMIYIGRACEEGSIKAKRLDCGLWAPEQAEIDAHITAILADASLRSHSDRARALSERTGKGFEACRALLRRTKVETPKPGDSLRTETVGQASVQATQP